MESVDQVGSSQTGLPVEVCSVEFVTGETVT